MRQGGRQGKSATGAGQDAARPHRGGALLHLAIRVLQAGRPARLCVARISNARIGQGCRWWR
eukprot:8028748-Alexandrium_andersonii.AAC.1